MHSTSTPQGSAFDGLDILPSGDTLGLFGDILDFVRLGRAAVQASRAEQDDDGIIELTEADLVH